MFSKNIEVKNTNISYFRFLLGISIFYETLYNFFTGISLCNHLNLTHTITYPLLDWLPQTNSILNTVIFLSLLLFSFLFSIGVFSYLSSIITLLSFFYFFTFNKVFYTDYSYLYIILILLFTFLPLKKLKRISLKKGKLIFFKGNKIKNHFVDIFRIQLIIVYFYLAIQKLNIDWLSGNFFKAYFADEKSNVLLLKILNLEIESVIKSPYFLAFITFLIYATIIYHLIIIPLIYNKKTQKFGIYIAIIYNTLDYLIFSLNSFALFNFLALILLFDKAFIQRYLDYITNNIFQNINNIKSAKDDCKISKIKKLFLAIIFIWQFLMPLRPFYYYFVMGEDSNYTFSGQRFSWRINQNHINVKGQITYLLPHENKLIKEKVKNNIQPKDVFFYYNPTLLLKETDSLIQFANISKTMIEASLNEAQNDNHKNDKVEKPKTVITEFYPNIKLSVNGSDYFKQWNKRNLLKIERNLLKTYDCINVKSRKHIEKTKQ